MVSNVCVCVYQPALCVHPSSISYNELLKQQEIDAATEQKYIADKDAAYVKNIGDATEQAHASGLLLLHTFLDARPDLAEDLCRLGLERICKRSLKRRSRRSSIPTIAGRILALLEREVGPVRRRARGDGALLSAAEDSLEGGRGSARGVTAGVGGADDDGCVIV